MKLPTPVYEYLPLIYIIAGVLLAANFDNALGNTAEDRMARCSSCP